MTSRFYRDEAQKDAAEMIQHFKSEILEELKECNVVTSDVMWEKENLEIDVDAYHHENHVDKEYTLQEAADILEQLSEFKEKDSGLWQDQEPIEAVCTQAAYTYGNAVIHFWKKKIEAINDGWEDHLDALFAGK